MAKEPGNKPDYRAALSEKQYLKMIFANIISRFGDSLDLVAFGFLVYEITDSATWVAIIAGFNVLPTVLLQPFAGAWANYLNKKWVMVCCDLGRGFLVLLIAVLFMAGSLTPGLLLVITILNSSLEALRMPCGMAVLPKVLKKENMATAMSLNKSASTAASLLGTGLSGIIIAWLGVGGAILIDAITFVGSGLVLCFLQIPNDTERATGSYLKELREGLGYFIGNKTVVILTLLCCLLNVVEWPFNALKVPFINETLRMGTDALSVGSATMSIGLLVGTLVFPYVFGRVRGFKVFVFCGCFVGLVYFGLVGSGLLASGLTRLWVFGLLSLLYGISFSTIDMALGVVMVQNVEGSFMARVGGIFNSLACASEPVAALCIGFAVSFLPVGTIYIMTGVLAVVAFGLLPLSKTMRALK